MSFKQMPTPPPPYQTSSKYDPRSAVPDAPYESGGRKKSGCGCWFYGCFGIILLFLGFCAAIYFGFKQVSTKIESITSATQSISEANLSVYSEVEYQKVLRKINIFLEVLASAKGNPEISLSAFEVNSLLTNHPNLADVKGKLLVEIVNDTLVTNVSFPLTELGFSNKFLNAKGEWKIDYSNDNLTVTVHNIKIGNNSLPSVLAEQIEGVNIGEQIMSDPEDMEKLKSVEKISITQGKITIKMKQNAHPINLDEAKTSI